MVGHLLQRFVRAVGVFDGHDLDFVKLVQTVEAAHVLAVGAGLATETGGIGAVFQREVALFAYQGKDSLTDNSRPKAILYNPNVDGTFYMHKPITHIMRDDSTSAVSFTFRNMAVRPDSLPVDTTDYVKARPMTPTTSRVSVYTSDGRLVISSVDRNRLEGLRPGLYVLRREDGLTEKVMINH